MKKNLVLVLIVAFLSIIILTGCGPKMANQKTMAELDELKNAADAAEMEAADCQKKVEELNAEKAALQAEIDSLKNEINKY